MRRVERNRSKVLVVPTDRSMSELARIGLRAALLHLYENGTPVRAERLRGRVLSDAFGGDLGFHVQCAQTGAAFAADDPPV